MTARSTSKAASRTAARVNVWPRPYQSRIRRSGSPARAISRRSRRSPAAATCSRPSCSRMKSARDVRCLPRALSRRGLPGGGGTAYMPLVYTADSEAEAEKGAQELSWYINAKVEPQFRNPPGYVPVALNVKALQGAYAGRTDAMRAQGLDYRASRACSMYGTPGFGRRADQALPRSRRRLRSPADDAAGRLPRPQAHGRAA